MKSPTIFKQGAMFLMLALILVAFGCKKDPVYKSVAIKQFTVHTIPFVKPDGTPWENLPLIEGGPDVYWLLTDVYDSIYYGDRSVRFDNVTPQMLPLVRILSTPHTITPLEAAWYIKVYDHDLIGGDDLMATIGPFSFDTWSKTHPSTITLSGDSVTIDLSVEWLE